MNGSGAHFGERLPAFAGDQLELAPPGTGPLMPGKPGVQFLLQHSGEAFPGWVGDDLDLVLGVPFAEHFAVECARTVSHNSESTRGERG